MMRAKACTGSCRPICHDQARHALELAAVERHQRRAAPTGLRGAADGLKQDLREDVVAAGLGERLSRTWQGKAFPEVGESAEAAAYIWSRAPKIVDAFDRGVVIRRDP